MESFYGTEKNNNKKKKKKKILETAMACVVPTYVDEN